jgi:hypothetical protein
MGHIYGIRISIFAFQDIKSWKFRKIGLNSALNP